MLLNKKLLENIMQANVIWNFVFKLCNVYESNSAFDKPRRRAEVFYGWKKKANAINS